MGFAEIWAQGNLTQDAKFDWVKSGKALLKFSLAVNTGKDAVDYYDVDAWDKTAEIWAELHKGDGVVVKGRMSLRKWTDKSGNQRTSPTITADRIMLIAKRTLGEVVQHVAATAEEPPEDLVEEVDLSEVK